MPVKFVTADELAELTGGYRGSVYIGPTPVRRPKRHEVFLCLSPCYAPLTVERLGVFRCSECAMAIEDPRAT